jgi:hypothetical protein
MSNWHLPRRTFLRGLGTAMALPVLESMLPGMRLLGAEPGATGVATTAGGFPKRLAYVYVPNGINMAEWTPAVGGTDYETPVILQKVAAHRKDLLVVSGLAHTQAQAYADGSAAHARASAAYLTGCNARKTEGADVRLGVSADQIAARQLGHLTRLPSLELSCARGARTGTCDTGYSCVYQFNISWKNETQPMSPEVDPRLAFERLFGSGDPALSAEARARREQQKLSVLDFVRDDARSLQKRLGAEDNRKLDEYFSAVRDLERQLAQAEGVAQRLPAEGRGFSPPLDFDFEQHVGLMYEVMALAFQADATRISTFMIGQEGSNRPYPQAEVRDGHHDISHHKNDPARIAKISRVNQYHMGLFAKFLDRLKSVREGEGTLLDNCAIVYGGAISDGNSHSYYDLPVLVAGRAGGALATGRHLVAGQGRSGPPMNNFHRALLTNMGVKIDRFGDSTGTLDQIFSA